MQHSKQKTHGGLLVICALTNNHNHLFSSEVKKKKKGTPVDKLAVIRSVKKARQCSGKQPGRDGVSPETDIRFNLTNRRIQHSVPILFLSFYFAHSELQQMLRSKSKHPRSRNSHGMCMLQMSIRLPCERTTGRKVELASGQHIPSKTAT